MSQDLVLNINKPLGITSYDVIRNIKHKYPGQKIGHAGTLDPLASGVLIVLVGRDANKRQAEFMDVEKEYEFDVLFGFGTDAYDILGLVTDNIDYDHTLIADKLRNLLRNYIGIHKQQVPPFSAVKINGKPLYRWYLDGKVDFAKKSVITKDGETQLPIKEIDVKKIDVLNCKVLSKSELNLQIMEYLNLVKTGFRNEEIKAKWSDILKNSNQNKFLIATLIATVSKGTYVRAIADDIGKKLGIFACTTVIKRTKVGLYKINS